MMNNVTIGHDDLHDAIIVQIHQVRSEADEGTADSSYASASTEVSKMGVTRIAIKCKRFSLIVGYPNIHPTIVVIISGRDAHAPIGAVPSHPPLHHWATQLHEALPLFIEVQEVVRSVIGT